MSFPTSFLQSLINIESYLDQVSAQIRTQRAYDAIAASFVEQLVLRVTRWSAAQSACILIVGLGQVFLVRRFFN
ncbi:unnamed protein product [Protopolystoma xenopodis]|uniref:GOLD domain-containing protein n=1 Tax=Protopolystoma xenopodis TaxID=117903 RepID=A0A448WLM6_9PLAT|nr:unnamed protein product [Protopolystoma xenopodis]